MPFRGLRMAAPLLVARSTLSRDPLFICNTRLALAKALAETAAHPLVCRVIVSSHQRCSSTARAHRTPFVFVARPAVTVTCGHLVLRLTSALWRISSYAATPFICAHDSASVSALVLVVSFRFLRAPWPRRLCGASRCYHNMRVPSRLHLVPRTSFVGPFVGTTAHTSCAVPSSVHKQLVSIQLSSLCLRAPWLPSLRTRHATCCYHSMLAHRRSSPLRLAQQSAELRCAHLFCQSFSGGPFVGTTAHPLMCRIAFRSRALWRLRPPQQRRSAGCAAVATPVLVVPPLVIPSRPRSSVDTTAHAFYAASLFLLVRDRTFVQKQPALVSSTSTSMSALPSRYLRAPKPLSYPSRDAPLP
ncbi:hypothetical protein DFH07DRAFT_973722 [Mycena maculata]|uniref:Uncharacterized protein n=1 Tax=Mycena maculata TaxID=230809 RepID=A0AAD7HBU5_9AGAR|nr:hypothetical protein DFH07DRAFT_973722 [Mycena maculata]